MAKKRFITDLHSNIFVSFVLMGVVLAGIFAAVVRSARDLNTILVATLLVFVIVSLLGWIAGSLISRGLVDITHDVLRMRDTITLEHPQHCDVDHYRFVEVANLCNAINDIATVVVRERGRLRDDLEAEREQLADSRELLHNFMYYIAHKLRTPLNGIRWSAEILKNEEEGELSTRQRASLDDLEHAAVAVLDLAHDLQDVFTIEMQGQVQLRGTSTQVQDLVDDVAGQWAVLARQKRVELTVHHPSDGLPLVFGDPVRIRQVVDDLVDNAVRYTPPSGQIEISTGVVTAASSPLRKRMHVPAEVGDAVIVCIRDSGIGIPKEDQGHVFSKFFRARNAKDQWVDGTGIGLTLAKRMVEAHGGRIWFRSDVGKGSLFCFAIPLDRSPAHHKT